jgi:hypothetical protein
LGRQSPYINSIFTSSVQEAGVSGNYYLNVFQTGSTQTAAAVQFNIAFGDSEGSGSVLYDAGIDGKSFTSTSIWAMAKYCFRR